MPNLHTLPTELQMQIAEYLVLKSDQKNLCLVCKKFCDVGTPLLYKDMVIEYNRLGSIFGPTANTKEHHGLAHVRTLRIGSFMFPCLYKALYRLLSAIPKDTLTRLTLPSPSELDEDLERLVRTQQRKLTNYQYCSPERETRRPEHHYPATFLLPSGDALSCVTTLHVYINNAEDCKRAGMILKRATRVTSLAVELACAMEPEKFASGMTDTKSMGRVVVENVFRAAYEDRGLLKLAALRFEGMTLERVGEQLQGFVVLEDLRHLQLSHCYLSDLFLEALSQKCPSLESFALEGGLVRLAAHGHKNSIDRFLTATSLRRLIVKTSEYEYRHKNGKGSVAFATLLPHAEVIQCLVLDDVDTKFSVCSPQREGQPGIGFKDLCKSLQSLQQICVVCPRIGEDFLVDNGFLDFMDSLQHLHRLRLLKLLVDDPHDSGQIYHEVAEKIFEVLLPSCPQFVALVFESRIKPQSDTYVKTMLATMSFVRPEQMGQHAQARFLGVDVKPDVVRDYEPCADILETEELIFSPGPPDAVKHVAVHVSATIDAGIDVSATTDAASQSSSAPDVGIEERPLDHRARNHEGWRFLRGRGVCAGCHGRLPVFLMECRTCRMRACRRCTRNEL